MATKNKTTQTDADVTEFVNSFVQNDSKREDAFHLIKLLSKWSGYKPKMWGSSIIGFGSYHYKYASGREGDAPILGFSPRKAAISLYVTSPEHNYDKFLDKLGKFKMSKACIYVNKLSDVNLDVLEKICNETIKYHNKTHGSGS